MKINKRNFFLRFGFGLFAFMTIGTLFYVNLTQSDEFQYQHDIALLASQSIFENGTTYDNPDELFFSTLVNSTVNIQPEQVSIVTNLQKITKLGEIEKFSTESPKIPLTGSFVTEQNKNLNYEGGKFKFDFLLKTDRPNTDIDFYGVLNVKVNDVVIPGGTIDITGGGKTNNNGTSILSVDTINGFYEFSFDKQFSDLIDGTNNFEIVITDIKIEMLGKTYTAENLKVYSNVLDKDERKLLVKNEQGDTVKVFKSDIKFSVGSFATSPRTASTCNSSTRGSCTNYSYHYCAGIPAPTVGAITLTEKSTGKLIASSPYYPNNGGKYTWYAFRGDNCHNEGGAWKNMGSMLIDVNLQRATSYKFKISEPQNIEFTFTTPEKPTVYYMRCTGGQHCGSNVFHE